MPLHALFRAALARPQQPNPPLLLPPGGAVNLIAMASPEDMRADAEHIRMADQFVEVRCGWVWCCGWMGRWLVWCLLPRVGGRAGKQVVQPVMTSPQPGPLAAAPAFKLALHSLVCLPAMPLPPAAPGPGWLCTCFACLHSLTGPCAWPLRPAPNLPSPGARREEPQQLRQRPAHHQHGPAHGGGRRVARMVSWGR